MAERSIPSFSTRSWSRVIRLDPDRGLTPRPSGANAETKHSRWSDSVLWLCWRHTSAQVAASETEGRYSRLHLKTLDISAFISSSIHTHLSTFALTFKPFIRSAQHASLSKSNSLQSHIRLTYSTPKIKSGIYVALTKTL